MLPTAMSLKPGLSLTLVGAHKVLAETVINLSFLEFNFGAESGCKPVRLWYFILKICK